MSQHGLKRRIQKLGTLVTLHHVTRPFIQYVFKGFRDFSTGLCSDGHGPGTLAENVDAREQVLHAIVEQRQTRDVHQFDLIEVHYTF